MPNDRYPSGTVRELLTTGHVSPQTRDAIERRLAEPPIVAPTFFDGNEFAVLRAVCDRLVPQSDRAVPIDLAGSIDRRLAAGGGDGWRYDALPPDGEAYRLGLRGLAELAQSRHGAAFSALDQAQQDGILTAVQRGAVAGGAWDRLPPRRFFEELLAEAVQVYYAHPLAQEEIGYAGMADLPRWGAVGLDERDGREPRPIDGTDG